MPPFTQVVPAAMAKLPDIDTPAFAAGVAPLNTRFMLPVLVTVTCRDALVVFST